MKTFMQNVEYQNSEIRVLTDFLKKESEFESSGQTRKMRFVGYVLEIGFEEVKIITSDPYKVIVGGVPRGSYLIMCPSSFDELPPHFTLLRVNGVATTPLKQETQQTYFELHKKSMPELDIWTKSELQWSALSTKVLGMFYSDPKNKNKLTFSGDVNNVVNEHHYKIFSPTDELLDLIINGIVNKENKFTIGKLRLTECSLPFMNIPAINVPVQVSTNDFRGFRTAMFGKTRLGKSNVVKLIAQSILETTTNDKSVGQLIFDVNGEYANDNPQDKNKSLRSAYEDRCKVYALTKRENTPSKPLRLNFYEQPDSTIQIISTLLENDNQTAQYVKSFSSVELPNIEELKSSLDRSFKTRGIRKIQIYWAILSKAGFKANEDNLKQLGLTCNSSNAPKDFEPHFRKELIQAIYNNEVFKEPTSLEELQFHLEKVSTFIQNNKEHKSLENNGKATFDADDLALLKFLNPPTGGGPQIMRSYIKYHDKNASNFVNEILELLDGGSTVILDLGNADDKIRMYFSDLISKNIFKHQEKKFVSNKLEKHFIQLYFEEAHNLFPRDGDVTGVYARFAKEGAKFHIGMLYSTQSPSTINKELLIQTENFFVGHISSIDEVNTLSRLQILFDDMQKDITLSRTPGFMRMLTFSNRFVVPVQTKLFEPINKD
ncbi:ATP-binding protein [Aliarcobacter cryaerophilus]|uniref:ATP-binding protein n=1 Tax=Aliarcobacter cryaerophilus TaxID=28198 RepID=UPI003BB0BD77